MEKNDYVIKITEKIIAIDIEANQSECSVQEIFAFAIERTAS